MKASRAAPRPRTAAWALVFLVLFFSGCTEDAARKEPKEDFIDTHDPDSPTQKRISAHGLIPPEWDYGDWWRYENTAGEQTAYVVTNDTDATWTVDTDSESTAFFDARFDISFVGTLRKPDLAGQQGDDWVEYIKWPLKDGIEWTTKWDGVERTVRATERDTMVFTMEAYEGDRLAVRYTYDHDIRWFTSMMFFDTDGSEFGMRLVESGHDFDGTLYRYTLEEAWSGAGPDATGVGGTAGPTFEVSEAHTDIWVGYTLDCQHGVFSIAVAPVADAQSGWRDDRTCPQNATVEAATPTVPGTWSIEVAGVMPGGDARFEATVMLRTLETVDWRRS
ncbi:MAG: hypothetical protein KY455_01865 [Euryarchaeota archaeon]|nr:hypothetical protein [Euryarchaeota archaeon]